MTPRTPFALSIALALAFVATVPVTANDQPRPGSIQAVRATAENSLFVTGTIDVDAAGNVVAWTIDQPDKLPAGVVKMANDRVPTWTFEPITLPEGVAYTRSRMGLLFVARQVQGDQYEVTLRHRSFRPENANTMRVRDGSLRLEYPPEAGVRGVSATVYAVIRIDRSGKVLDAAIEQVNLRVVDNEGQMAIWRDLFGRAVLRASKSMRIDIPEGIFADGEQTIIARLPISFRLAGTRGVEYGRWQVYVPGPRAAIPWPDAAHLAKSPPDALVPDLLNSRDPMGRTLRDDAGQ